jgi:hypothetical protein
MRDKTVLVTGATGFVGQNVTKKLLEDGYFVCAIVRNPEKLKNLFLEYPDNLIPIKIKNPEEKDYRFYSKLITDYNISSIIHIAAITGERNISWEEYYKTNVLWTKNLAYGFVDANINHNVFIFTSTVGVYGTIPKYLPADESHPYDPDGKYHKSKALAEKELLSLKEEYDFPLVIFRPTTIYGKGDYSFLYKISKLVKKRSFFYFNNPKISLIDVDYLSSMYFYAVKNKISGIYNIAENPITLEDLLRFIKKATGGKYYKLPSFLLKVVLQIPNDILRIKLKLITFDRYYSTKKIEKLGLPTSDTLKHLEKYMEWYNERKTQ